MKTSKPTTTKKKIEKSDLEDKVIVYGSWFEMFAVLGLEYPINTLGDWGVNIAMLRITEVFSNFGLTPNDHYLILDRTHIGASLFFLTFGDKLKKYENWYQFN